MKRRLFFLLIILSAPHLQKCTMKHDGPMQSYGQDILIVDAGQIIGPALQRGSGFLQGYNDGSTVHDSLFLPIKCRFQRSGKDVIAACYERNRKAGCSMEVILNSGWDKTILPGLNGNWKPWEDHVAGIVSDLKSRGMTEDMSFSIWDNPDRGQDFWPDAEHYFEAWCRAYKQVKRLLPSAKMVGPNSEGSNPANWWPSYITVQNWKNWADWIDPDHNIYYVLRFLDYTIARECTPDIIARHDHYKEARYIESDDARLKKYYADRGIAAIPFEQDDVGARFSGGPEQFSPGHYVALFAAIERVKVLRTCKCCWDKDCSTNTLNGLLTKGTRQKRSLWWLYKEYADITGDILYVKKAGNIDAVAGWNKDENMLRLLIGRNSETTGKVTVIVKNFNYGSATSELTGSYIPFSNADPVPRKPLITLRNTIKAKKGELIFSLDDLGSNGACSIEIRGL